MKALIKSLSVVSATLLFTGCASIVSKSNWPVVVGTNPVGASISITNKKGMEVYKGTTPAALTLKSGAGYFAKESYQVKISMKGYEEKVVRLECQLNGWYAGNILIGGIVGLLIVDPATGAMYKLGTDAIHETLMPTSSSYVQESPVIQILNISDIPTHWNKYLVSLQN